MLIHAIDPGTTQSAHVKYDSEAKVVRMHEYLPNEKLIKKFYDYRLRGPSIMVIEQIKSYGMPMGDDLIHTCFWTGRFIEAWRKEYYLLPRKTIVTTLCGSPRANDSHIRQYLIDLFGPSTKQAVGTKTAKGPLYGMKVDARSALAVALAWVILNPPPEKPKPPMYDLLGNALY